jgi:FixJ family two-component response regulator
VSSMIPDPYDERQLLNFLRLARAHWDMTPIEAEVAFHLCRGLTHEGIARELGLARQTVKNRLVLAGKRVRGDVTRANCAALTVRAVWPVYSHCVRDTRARPPGRAA